MTHVQDYYFYRREEDVTFLSLSCFTCTFFMIEYVFANTLLLLVFVRIFGLIKNHAMADHYKQYRKTWVRLDKAGIACDWA